MEPLTTAVTSAKANLPADAPGSTAPRRRGRPSRPVLSREGITAGALAVIARAGYEGFTMAALARELKTAPSALYNHVASKDEVLNWVQDDVNETIDVSGFGRDPWDLALMRWAHSYRDAFAEHSPLIPVIAVLPITGAPHTLAMYERVAEGLRSGGWPEDMVIDTIVAVESFVLGSAMDVSAPEWIFNVGDRRDLAPTFADAVAARRGSGRTAADDAFALGLNALVAGLRATLAAAQAARH
ncbi:TetR/AcrR family transcriptional regulator [Sinomonas sp. JGH33]|uniref:TetR/AcrR family transcriptional regulator n=1 Tax=Sinomonas terricola TaxID=3110330 RepID=A0ABU5T7P1_9MICC|nr:TetR/AcrR family transcriptional regulator [Sinomonas sp. JGH33]MEA5455702.1 TetR/AcrR family transcriptional regulator [Sinomonas sp. JGH33]